MGGVADIRPMSVAAASKPTNAAYLPDALGSVRQVMKTIGEYPGLTLAKSYDPYGEVIYSNGAAVSYGFTGEAQDSYIKLVNLRSRLYSTETGRFLTRDTWQGDYNTPLSLNKWNYVEANPVNYTDPSGNFPNQSTLDNYLEHLRKITKNCYDNGDRQCVWNSYFNLALFGRFFGYPHASNHMLNFLTKGNVINYSNTSGRFSEKDSKWIFSNSTYQDSLWTSPKELWKTKQKRAKQGESKGTITTNKRPTDYPELGSDEYYALGAIHVWIEAEYEIKGRSQLSIKPIYHFFDEYDWHPCLLVGGGIGGLGGFQDAWAASLEPDLINGFDISGSWSGSNKVYEFPDSSMMLIPQLSNVITWKYLDPRSKQTDIFPNIK